MKFKALLNHTPGTYVICPICNWEDDEVQFYDPTYAGGANKLCLKEAQEKYRLDVNKKFVASLHKTVIEEGKILYKTLYETSEITKRTTDYWKETIAFYQSLDDNQRSVLLNIVEQTMVDTISSVLGVLDGAGTLSGENFEFDIKINGMGTEDELQDIFLAYVEERVDNRKAWRSEMHDLIFEEYFANKISEETLIKTLGIHDKEFPVNLRAEMEKVCAEQNSKRLEILVYALFLWEETCTNAAKMSLSYFVDILKKLLLCSWHKQHENIVGLLQKIADEGSLECLYHAIYLKLQYLEWDDNYSFQVRCVRAISSIGGEKATQYLKLLSREENPVIQEIAERKLNERTGM